MTEVEQAVGAPPVDRLQGPGSAEPFLVTQAEYARRRGISRQAVHKAIKLGRLSAVGKLINVPTADREWWDNTDPSQLRLLADPPANPGPAAADQPEGPKAEPGDEGSAPKSPTVYGEKARHEGLKASLTQLDLEERARALTDVEGVAREQFGVARSVRDGLLNLPHELSTRVASATGMGEEDCFDLLDDYVRKLCDKLADEAALP